MHSVLFMALFESMRTAASNKASGEPEISAEMRVEDAYINCTRTVRSKCMEISPSLPQIFKDTEEQAEAVSEFLRSEKAKRDEGRQYKDELDEKKLDIGMPAPYIAFLLQSRGEVADLGYNRKNVALAAFNGISNAYEAFRALLSWLESVEAYEHEISTGRSSAANPAKRARVSKSASAEEHAERGIVDNFRALPDGEKFGTLVKLSKFVTDRLMELKRRYIDGVTQRTITPEKAFMRRQVISIRKYWAMAVSLTDEVVPLAHYASVVQPCAGSIRSAMNGLENAWDLRDTSKSTFPIPLEDLKTLDGCRSGVKDAQAKFKAPRSAPSALSAWPRNEASEQLVGEMPRYEPSTSSMSADRRRPAGGVPRNEPSVSTVNEARAPPAGKEISDEKSWVDLHEGMVDAYNNCHRVTMQIAQKIGNELEGRILAMNEQANKVAQFSQPKSEKKPTEISAENPTKISDEKPTEISDEKPTKKPTRSLLSVKAQKDAIWALHKNSGSIQSAVHDGVTGVYEIYLVLFRYLERIEHYEQATGLSSVAKTPMPPKPEILSDFEELTSTADRKNLRTLFGLCAFVNERSRALNNCYKHEPSQEKVVDPRGFMQAYLISTKKYFMLADKLYKLSALIAQYASRLKTATESIYNELTMFIISKEKKSQNAPNYDEVFKTIEDIRMQMQNVHDEFTKAKPKLVDPFNSAMDFYKGKPAAALDVPSWQDYSYRQQANRKRRY
ncbi:hypothetical protein PAPHI01_1743 [Pancytospora philotis]|nr:hypothetical protein PAPHI01_1743 [Pancytospora philotis]